MRKVKVRTLYLIAIIVGGLVGLATKSTYAMFTASAEIDNPICMSANLTSEEETIETMEVSLSSGELKEMPITINNTSTNTLNYMVFYERISSDIEIGINMKNADSSNSSGIINIGETKKVYVQIKNNESSSIVVIIGVVSNNISSDMEMIPSGKDGESAIEVGSNLAEFITNLYTDATKTTVTNNSITYNYATSVNLMNDRLASLSTDINAGNIRYYGANPSNYIYFNCSDYSNQSSSTCETWRIIGVFDGKVKITRGSNIGSYSWNNKNESTGAINVYGNNDWPTSRLMKLLNPSNYYTVDSKDNGNGQSLYWNAESGTCFSGQNNATKACDFTSSSSTIGLKNDATRNMISESVWYLRNSLANYVNVVYENERLNGTVGSERVPTWTGKVALPYPSDYGYATNLAECQKQLTSYSDTTCTGSNWMKNIITNYGNSKGWLITPNMENVNYVYYVNSAGNVYGLNLADNNFAYAVFAVLPTLYLNYDLTININENSKGTIAKPYQIVMN